MSEKFQTVSFDLYSSVMGITGLGLVWRAAAKTYDVSALPGEVFLATGLAVFLVLTGIQLLRLVFCRQIILAEWHSRASKNFFCAATISGFLLAVVPLTMFLLGPFGKYLGDYLASAIVYIIGVNSLVAGMIIGAAYSFIVLFGLHWAIIPVVFSNIAHGGDPIYAIGGMSAIAQMGVALGILIRTRDTGTRQLASSAFFPSLISGVTEPILYGLIIPNRRTIYYIIIAGAVGGGIVGGYNITINNLVFASLLSIPTASNMLIYSVGLFATLITGAVLPVIFGYKSRF